MSEKGAGFTLGQLMVAVLVGAITIALCITVEAAIRRKRATDFPPAPPPFVGKRLGYGDK